MGARWCGPLRSGGSSGRAVKAGRRPPAGEALTARSGAVHIMEFEARQGFVVVPLVVPRRGRIAGLPHCQASWQGDPGTRAPFISSSELRHEVVRPQPAGLNQSHGLAARECGDLEASRARSGLRPFRVSSCLGQATDLAVTQAVVDEDEKLARRRYSTDPVPPAFGDSVVVDLNRRRAGGPPPRRRPSGPAVNPAYLWVLVVSTQLSGRAHRGHGQGGQGRAEAARRGSLDSPVTCSEQAEMRKSVRASCLHLLWS